MVQYGAYHIELMTYWSGGLEGSTHVIYYARPNRMVQFSMGWFSTIQYIGIRAIRAVRFLYQIERLNHHGSGPVQLGSP